MCRLANLLHLCGPRSCAPLVGAPHPPPGYSTASLCDSFGVANHKMESACQLVLLLPVTVPRCRTAEWLLSGVCSFPFDVCGWVAEDNLCGMGPCSLPQTLRAQAQGRRRSVPLRSHSASACAHPSVVTLHGSAAVFVMVSAISNNQATGRVAGVGAGHRARCYGSDGASPPAGTRLSPRGPGGAGLPLGIAAAGRSGDDAHMMSAFRPGPGEDAQMMSHFRGPAPAAPLDEAQLMSQFRDDFLAADVMDPNAGVRARVRWHGCRCMCPPTSCQGCPQGAFCPFKDGA